MTGPVQLSKNIRVIPETGEKLMLNSSKATSVMDRSTGGDFISRITKAFEVISRLNTGQKLIDAIDATNHECVIYCGGAYQKEAAVAMLQNPTDFKQLHNMMINSFRPSRENMLQMKQKKDKNAIDWFEKEYSKFWGSEGRAQTMNETAYTEFCGVMHNAKKVHSDPVGRFAKLAGFSEDRLYSMILGAEPFPDFIYYPLCYEYYEFLNPREGAPTQIRCSHKVKAHSTAGDEKQKSKGRLHRMLTRHSGNDYSKYNDGASAVVVLAHEMIHAWRMMAGRRVVHSGWGEEAMTVGIDFASDWPLTENKIRADLGHPLRFTYPEAVPTNQFDLFCKTTGYQHVWNHVEEMT